MARTNVKEAIKKSLRPAVAAVWSTRLYRSILWGLDILAARIPSDSHPLRGYTLLLGTDGKGNIGDQAMIDAFLENTAGIVVVVVGHGDDLVVNPRFAGRLRIAVVSGLVKRPPLVRFGSVRRFAALLKGADRFGVFGADTIDGGHVHASLARLSLLNLANRASVPSTVYGFSWAEHAPTTTVRALSDLQRKTRLVVRDPVSYERLVRSGITAAISAADIVFAADARTEPYSELNHWLTDAPDASTPFVIVNMSGLIAKRADLVPDYAILVDQIHQSGMRILFLPHVIRDEDNDVRPTHRLYDLAGHDMDFLVDRVLRPSDVRYATRFAQIVFTGRMHLAILSLSNSTPAVTFSTSGKVEGLYALFGLAGFGIEPSSGVAPRLVDLFRRVTSDREGYRTRVEARLPLVRELAGLNFDS